MSDESSDNGREASSPLPPPPTVRSKDDQADPATRKANARAVGLDTAFLEALGDEFEDAPEPAGRLAPGGTLVVEGGDTPDVERERDAVLSREFLDETTPTPTIDSTGEGPLLFETAAAESQSSTALNLPSGGFPDVSRAGESLPGVLAAFESGSAAAELSDSDMVVSVVAPEEIEGALTEELQDEVPEEVADAMQTVEQDEQDAKAAVIAPGPSSSPPSSSPPSSSATTPDEPDHKKYALLAAGALLLVIAGIALTRGGDSDSSASAKLARAGGADAAAEGADESARTENGGASAADAAEGERIDANANANARVGTTADGADGAAAGNDAALEAADTTAGAAAAQAASGSTGAGDIAIDDESGADDAGQSDGQLDGQSDDQSDDGGTPGTAPLPAGDASKQAARDAEDQMSAKELREASRKAITQHRYSDAYRLAGKAQRKEPGEAALTLRVESACGMKNKAAAKSAIDSISNGKTRRDLRARCRDLDVRLGI